MSAHRMARRLSRFSAALTGAVVVAGLQVAAAPVARAATPLPDGLSSFTAAASCWEIKQNQPSAGDGVYWLVTPALVAPTQFYCDMTTDGGGWVLIGRGREGWVPQYEGKGTTAQVASAVTGTDAFAVRQLSSLTVDGLLNGRRVDALSDGVRIRRALNTAGTSWQEVRFKFANRSSWQWTLGAEHPVSTWTIGGASGSGGQTSYLGTGSTTGRLDTRNNSSQGWVRGLAYGPNVYGSSADTSYLWSKTATTGAAMPFAQMFLRPRLRLADLDFGTVPDSGTPARELTPLLQNSAQPNTWGVTGLANGVDTELTTEVQSFTQIGTTVYVGGNFRYVQKGADATGPDKVEQSYLAAFDATTGDWIPGFRPTLNGQVKSLAALPNGLVVAGGEFTSVNGSPASGMVALDATTGATATTWPIKVENRTTSSSLSVRTLKVAGSWLYLGGNFTHVTGGDRVGAVYAKNAARVRVSDGRPDATWNPLTNGTVVALDVDPSGENVYIAGYFTTAQGLPAYKAAQLSAVTGAPNQSWAPTWSTNPGKYQQAVGVVGSKVFVGGSEHGLFSWDTATWQRTSGSIAKAGGDFQTIGVRGNMLMASCHCNDWVYQDAYTWSDVGTAWTQAHKIGYIGIWNATTGAYEPEFDPILDVRRGSGGWANITDATGVTWFGGDFTKAKIVGGTTGWAGGFVRFAMRDSTAPGTPGGLALGANTDAGATLSWSSSGANAHYEVIEDNRVVATTATTSITVPAVAADTRFFVRAVDTSGNRSASTAALVVPPPSAPQAPAAPVVTASAANNGVTLRWPADAAVASYRILRDGNQIGTAGPGATSYVDGSVAPLTDYSYAVYAVGSNGLESTPGAATARSVLPLVTNAGAWRWRFDSAAWPAAWRDPGFDDSAWSTGTAPLGFGSALVATNIDVASGTTRPLSAQFRRAFTVADPGALSSVQVTVWADDGVVVYVNGTEVGRANLPAGTLTQNTYALSGPRTSAASAAPVTFSVPAGLLVAGTNVVTASTQLGWRATPDASFELSMTGR